jgi:hypothetical protein
LKTKKVHGVDLSASSFAFVGDVEDPKTWKLPLYFPNDTAKTINHIKNALFRFADTKEIPDAARTETWRTIAGAAKAHGIRVGTQPETVAKNAETKSPAITDEMEVDLKAARAVGELAAERFLKQIGY